MEKTSHDKILHYHLNEKIGSGFAGDVFHSWDSGLDRNVALRIITPDLANDSSFRTQLRDAAKAARELTHRNVAKTYSVEEVNGQLIVVTEFVQGQTLKSLVSQKPLDFRKFLKLSLGLAEALKAIHHLEISHRYITSDNVIILPDGSAKLTDLGIAPTPEIMKNSHTLMAPDKIVYLAPEFLQGHECGQVCDQYSLGVVLFEALTGNLPYEDSSNEQLINMIKNPASSKELFDEIERGDIYLLITKMTANLPEDRFSNIDELIATINEMDISQNHSRISQDAFAPTGSAVKSRIYLMVSLVFLLVVLFWLIVKGLGG